MGIETLYLKGIWKTGYFSVPLETTEEQIQFKSDEYQIRLGKVLEVQGWQVLEMLKPQVSALVPDNVKGLLPIDRRAYRILARVRKKPIVVHVDVEDSIVPELEKLGYKLNE